jgi:hypothetical protein
MFTCVAIKKLESHGNTQTLHGEMCKKRQKEHMVLVLGAVRRDNNGSA